MRITPQTPGWITPDAQREYVTRMASRIEAGESMPDTRRTREDRERERVTIEREAREARRRRR